MKKKCRVCKRHIQLHSNRKYCSKECRTSDENQRARSRRAAAKPARYCKNCGMLINISRRTSFCGEACYDAFNLDVRRQQYNPRVRTKTCCICGEIFSHNKGPIPDVCRKASCRKSHINAKNRDRWANLPEEAKKRKTASIDRYIKREDAQIIMAKCPGCHTMHPHKFTPAWIGNGVPRIGCSRYPHCMDNDGLYYLEERYEPFDMDNRVQI